jgi:small subunit ribosomal protein S21
VPKFTAEGQPELVAAFCWFSRIGEMNWLTTDRTQLGSNTIGTQLQVFVRDNNVDQALKALKRKMQREGIIRELKRRKAYEKPSERKNREKAEAIRRARKLARKKAQRDGLIPMPKRRDDVRRPLGRPSSF